VERPLKEKRSGERPLKEKRSGESTAERKRSGESTAAHCSLAMNAACVARFLFQILCFCSKTFLVFLRLFYLFLAR